MKDQDNVRPGQAARAYGIRVKAGKPEPRPSAAAWECYLRQYPPIPAMLDPIPGAGLGPWGGQWGTRTREGFLTGRGATRGPSRGGAHLRAWLGDAYRGCSQGTGSVRPALQPSCGHRHTSCPVLERSPRGSAQLLGMLRICRNQGWGKRSGDRARLPKQGSLMAWRPSAWLEPALPPASHMTLDTLHRIPGLL